MSTLPTAPPSTASWAAPVCSRENLCNGKPAFAPTSRAPSAAAATTSATAASLTAVRHRVDEHELVANVASHQVSDRDAKLAATVSGIAGDGAVRRQHGGVEHGVRPRSDLDNHIDAVGGDAKDLVGSAGGAVVDDVISPSRTSQFSLLVAADRRDHPRPRPARELNRSVTDRSCTAGNQHRLSGQSIRRQPPGPELRGGETDVRGQRWDAETGAHVERHAVGKRHRLTRGQGDVLLRGSVDPLPGRFPEPHPPADPGRVDALTDGIDGAGPVLVRDDLRVHELARRAAASRLPVSRIHARHRHAYAHLPGSRLGHWAIDQTHHVGLTGLRIHHCSHAAASSSDTRASTSNSAARSRSP